MPRKVNIFIWRLMLDRIPTRNAIKRRGMEIENVLCPICNVEEENLMHLFGRCEVELELGKHYSNGWIFKCQISGILVNF